jgi:hypothetical protein
MALTRPLIGVLAVLLLLALPATAPAAPAGCAQSILVDMRDGRIDRQYPVACYRAALERLPEDLRVYGTAEGDIQRALMSAVSRSAAEGGVSSSPTGSTAGPSGSWLAIAGGLGAMVGLVALVSLRSARIRRKH